MGHTDDITREVRKQTDAKPAVLVEARYRTRLVHESAMSLTAGSLRSFRSGSLEHHTQNDPVNDGDAGLVLNRVIYPRLGPDGAGEEPDEVVETLRSALGPEVRKEYPKAWCGTSKRGPKVHFGESVEGQDPTVDLVVALTRKGADGLWIPNLDKGTWEASHPEGHAKLLNAHHPTNGSLRGTRRKVIRLLKVWNKQFAQRAFTSFHLSVLALEFVQPGRSVAAALLDTLEATSKRMLAKGATPDPCNVSKNIRLVSGTSWETAERRTRLAADAVRSALAHDCDTYDTETRAYLAKVFHKYLDAPQALVGIISQAGASKSLSYASLGIAGTGLIPATRAYGDAARLR